MLAFQLGVIALLAFLCMASDLTIYSGKRFF